MKYFFLVIYIFFGSVICAQEPEVYTLQKCIEIGIKNNLDVISAVTQSGSAEIQLQRSAAAFLPFINAYASQGISTGKSINPYTNTFINQEVTTGQYGVNGSMNLFSGLYNYYTVRQMMYNNKAGKEDLEQIKIDISIQITLAYLQVLSYQELLKQAESQLEITKVQIDRLTVLENNNAISPSVLYDTRGQLANDKIYLINTRSALLSAKLSLSQLLNVTFSPAAVFEAVDTYEPVAQPVTVSDFYKDLPGMSAVMHRRQAAHNYKNSAFGLLFPSISLNGSIGTNYSSAALNQLITGTFEAATDAYVTVGGGNYQVFQPQYQFKTEKVAFNDQLSNNLNTYVGLNMQLPLLNGFRTHSVIAQSKLSLQLAIAREKNQAIKYKAVADQLSNDISASAEKLIILKQQEKDYEASFQIATAKFEKGAITTYDYVTAKTNYEKAKAANITARYEYALRSKVLSIYMGKK